MAERAGAAVDVDLVVRQAEVAHRDHRHHGEGLVDLEEVDVVAPTSRSLANSLLDRADRRGGEAGSARRRRPRGRRSRASGVSPRLSATRSARQHQRRGAVGDRAGVGRGDRAALAEGGLQRRDLVGPRLGRLLVVRDRPFSPCRA